MGPTALLCHPAGLGGSFQSSSMMLPPQWVPRLCCVIQRVLVASADGGGRGRRRGGWVTSPVPWGSPLGEPGVVWHVPRLRIRVTALGDRVHCTVHPMRSAARPLVGMRVRVTQTKKKTCNFLSNRIFDLVFVFCRSRLFWGFFIFWPAFDFSTVLGRFGYR